MRRSLVLVLALALLAILGWILGRDGSREVGGPRLPPEEPSTVRGPAPRGEALLAPEEPPLAVVDEESPPPSPAAPSLRTLPAVRGEPCGRVVDERTGEAVPEVVVFASRGDARASGTTDGAGWFETDAPGAGPGAIKIELVDAGVALASFSRDPAKEPPPWVLSVAIGPTYPLAFPAPARGSGRARLVESARDEDVAGELAVLPGEITLDRETSADDRTWSWQPVRPGLAPWIRYPSMEHEPDDRLRKRIEALGDDRRLHRGTARGTVGVQGTVGLRFLEVRMNVAGHVLDGQDRPIGGASVLLAPAHGASEGTRKASVWREALSGLDGSFAFDEVPSDAWNLFAWTVGPGSSFARERVVDDPRRSSVVLRPRASEGFVGLGDIPSAIPDRERAWLVLELAECAPFGRGWPLPLRGEGRAPPLPGNVSLARLCWLGEPLWSSAEADIGGRADAFPAHLERWTLQVADGPSGAPVEDAEVLLGPDGGIVTRSAGKASWLFPAEIELEWMVARAGYASAFGDENAFTTEEGARVARAVLWPGWGAALYFRAGPRLESELDPEADRTSALMSDVLGALASPPIPGVEVLADGVEAGTSDDHGAVRLAMDRVPLRLTLVRRHWRLTGLDRLAVPGSSALRYVVWLEPDPR